MNKDAGAVLIVPATENNRGGGHLTRALFLLNALDNEGRETYLWISEDQKDSVFHRFKSFFEASERSMGYTRGFHARLLSRNEDLLNRTWDFIILDRFRTPAEEFVFWSNLGPVIGIDEGGSCRNRFDFLVDLLPSLQSHESNLNAPCLLPLPRKRRPLKGAVSSPSETHPVRILISFGAEDSMGLGFLAARALAKAARKKTVYQDVTLISPGWDFSDRKQKQLPGVSGNSNFRVMDTLLNLREHLAEYDLFITHFGIGAFEAVYARVPVLLISPTSYHEKLSRNAGFFSLGLGANAAGRLESISIHNDFLKKLGSRVASIARRYGLEGEQEEDLGSFFGGIAPHAPEDCPLCAETTASGEKTGSGNRPPVLARFPEETYRRCPHCGAIHLSRLKSPPIEYGTDYFFEVYKKQYGKTYLEDFPNLVKIGHKRLVHIRALLGLKKKEEENEVLLHRPTLLDIGCAYGPFLAAAAECGFSPFGVDPVEDAIRYINEELGFHAWHGLFPTKAKAEDGPFDAITLWYTIEHFREPGKILQHIHGLLKDGGVLAFSIPSFSGVSGRKNLRVFLKSSPSDHWTIWSPRICRKIFSRYGYRLRKIIVTGHHPERFPFFGHFANPGRKGLFYRLLLVVSRVFRLGDTFEVYGVKS